MTIPSLNTILTGIVRVVAPFAAAFAVLAAFVLFTSDDFATRSGIMVYREQYRAELWLLLVFTASMSVIAFSRWLALMMQPLLHDWRLTKRTTRKKREREEQRQDALSRALTRLDSLSHEEQLLISRCIRENRQTIRLDHGHPAAEQLRAKRLLVTPSQAFSDLMFVHMFPDEVWEHLISNRELFLMDDDEEGARPRQWMAR